MEFEFTDLEKTVFDALTERGVNFVCQYPTTSGFVLDFVVAPNICIEADGPCHDSSKSKRRGWFRDKCLNAEGWKIFHLDYHVINTPERLNEELEKILAH